MDMQERLDGYKDDVLLEFDEYLRTGDVYFAGFLADKLEFISDDDPEISRQIDFILRKHGYERIDIDASYLTSMHTAGVPSPI